MPKQGGDRSQAGSRFLLAALLLVIAAAGCGYHLARPGNNLPPTIRRVAVPVLENQTMEPGLEALLTDQLRRRFAESGWVRISAVDDSDAVLLGKVVKFKTSPIAFNESDFAVEYRAQMNVWVRLVDREGRVLWEDRNLVKVREYRNIENIFDSEANKQNAIAWLAREISTEVHDRIFDGFE
ncbi:MAG: LptE family protein [Candidatus Lernaella stagnicola]|nr:LptE family protein [Candidatus Lernaella stagnicola]